VGYLEWLSGEIVKGVNSSSGEGEVKILKVVTDPFVDLIIQVIYFVLKPRVYTGNLELKIFFLSRTFHLWHFFFHFSSILVF
jgi:hypothetical protein